MPTQVRELLTPKQVARAIGVSEASLKRWCDKGLLPTQRTAGGHRRLPLAGVLTFLRDSKRELVRPEVLGLPSTSGQTEAVINRAVPRLCDALQAGDEERVAAILFDLHLAGHNLDAIGDRLIGPAFEKIGHGWETGDIEVYEEHRGTEVCLRALHRFSQGLPAPPADAPLALGGTIAGDPYRLPTTLVELVLRQLGWRAESLGPDHPADTLLAALRTRKPRVLWLSVSWMRSREAFVAEYNRIFEAAHPMGVAVVVGGNALTEAVREEIRYAAYCDTLSHLQTFVQTIHPSG